MSQQEPAFFDLEFFGDVPFWGDAEGSPRRTFLMPLPEATGFLAFGVVGPSDTVRFVARGKLREHLGEFITRMDRAGASVELYERPPLPWPFLKRYLSDEDYESYETEGPKNPPVNGIVAYGGGADALHAKYTGEEVAPISSDSLVWPAENTAREVIVIPLGCTGDFMAFGVCRPQPPVNKELFVFAARGRVDEQLGDFIARMKNGGASVHLHDWPPLGYLRLYVKKHFTALFAACAVAPPPTALNLFENRSSASG